MMTLDEVKVSVGRAVEYRPSHLRRCEEGEHGLIKSVSEAGAFVIYVDGTKFTRPGDLRLLS